MAEVALAAASLRRTVRAATTVLTNFDTSDDARGVAGGDNGRMNPGVSAAEKSGR
jgi:hypothetical protein